MTNLYGVTFEEYLEKTNDNKENFKNRFEKRIKLLKDNIKNLNYEIKVKGFNAPYNNNKTLEEAIREIELEIKEETRRFNKISML